MKKNQIEKEKPKTHFTTEIPLEGTQCCILIYYTYYYKFQFNILSFISIQMQKTMKTQKAEVQQNMIILQNQKFIQQVYHKYNNKNNKNNNHNIYGIHINQNY